MYEVKLETTNEYFAKYFESRFLMGKSSFAAGYRLYKITNKEEAERIKKDAKISVGTIFFDCKEVDEVGDEYCPHCEDEVVVRSDAGKQKCSNCGVEIKPCTFCDNDFVNCNSCYIDFVTVVHVAYGYNPMSMELRNLIIQKPHETWVGNKHNEYCKGKTKRVFKIHKNEAVKLKFSDGFRIELGEGNVLWAAPERYAEAQLIFDKMGGKLRNHMEMNDKGELLEMQRVYIKETKKPKEETKMKKMRVVAREKLTPQMIEAAQEADGKVAVSLFGHKEGIVMLHTEKEIEGTVEYVMPLNGVYCKESEVNDILTTNVYVKINFGTMFIDKQQAILSRDVIGAASVVKKVFGFKDDLAAIMAAKIMELDKERGIKITEIESRINDINKKLSSVQCQNGTEVYKKVVITGRKTDTGEENPVPPIDRGYVFVVNAETGLAEVFAGSWSIEEKAVKANLKDFNNKKLKMMLDGLDGALESFISSLESFERVGK